MGIALSDFVSSAITTSSASPTQPGFGVELVACQKTPAGFTNRVRAYSGTAGLITDGFATTDDAYLAVSASLNANPAAPLIKIGRRALQTTQVIKLQCQSATTGDIYSINIVTPAGVSTNISYTVPSSSTTTTVATAIAALIAAVSGFSGTTSSAAVITVTSPAAGTLNGYNAWTANFYITDTSADPGIATDMAAIVAEDANWYGLDIDSHSKAEVNALAAWAETNKRLFVTSSPESTVADSGVTTDVASTAQTNSYHYTAILYSQSNTKGFGGTTWQSLRYAGSPTPGNDTWAYNTLPGISADVLSETQIQTLGNKNATGYVNVQGVNITAAGGISITKSAGKSGSGEFLDTRRFLDWLNSQIQIGLYTTLLGSGQKTPFTDKGITSLANAVQGALTRGEQAGGLVVGSSVVTPPTAASVSTTDRASRILRNLNWAANLAGAVHLVQANGTVS